MQGLGARRLTAQTLDAITKWTRTSSCHSLAFTSQSNHENRDHQLFYDLLEACKLSLDIKTATETHTRIIRFGYGTNSSLVASLISTYVSCNQLNLARQVIRQVFSQTLNLAGLNIIIDGFMRSGEYVIAKKVFYIMPERDVVTWNSMIGGYVRNSRFEDTLRFFQDMVNSNVEPDQFTFASLITACARLGALNHALWLQNLMVQKRIEINPILCSALIDMYSKCGRIEAAKELFETAPRSDVSVWNSLINGLAIHGIALDAIRVFSKMEAENVKPDTITFLAILKACSHCGLVGEGRNFFDLMKNHYSVQPELEHYGVMVDLLGRSGLLEEAYAMIKAMPMEPDIVVWRTLLSACRTHKNTELGEVVVRNISRGKSGDYVLLSNMYCSQNRWDNAQGVREMMKKMGVRKTRGKSWFEWAGVIHHFKAGDKSHPESEALYKVLEGLVQRIKLEGFVPATELVMMDVSEEEKEENLYQHSEKLALAYGVLKTSPGTELRISKNLRICYDCHNWMKLVSRLLSRVILLRDRIRFHRFEGGSCSCGDYW